MSAKRDLELMYHVRDELAHDLAMVTADRDQLRYERQLLGAARSLLDEIASGDIAWFRVRRQAEDLAQRIVDEIGHPVTDEPALGPSHRARIAAAQTVIAKQCDDPDCERLCFAGDIVHDIRDALAGTDTP